MKKYFFAVFFFCQLIWKSITYLFIEKWYSFLIYILACFTKVELQQFTLLIIDLINSLNKSLKSKERFLQPSKRDRDWISTERTRSSRTLKKGKFIRNVEKLTRVDGKTLSLLSHFRTFPLSSLSQVRKTTAVLVIFLRIHMVHEKRYQKLFENVDSNLMKSSGACIFFYKKEDLNFRAMKLSQHFVHRKIGESSLNHILSKSTSWIDELWKKETKKKDFSGFPSFSV